MHDEEDHYQITIHPGHSGLASEVKEKLIYFNVIQIKSLTRQLFDAGLEYKTIQYIDGKPVVQDPKMCVIIQ